MTVKKLSLRDLFINRSNPQVNRRLTLKQARTEDLSLRLANLNLDYFAIARNDKIFIRHCEYF